MLLLKGVLSGLAAGVIAYFANTFLISRCGSRAVCYLTPAIEELLKSGLAVLFAGDIMASHVVFGAAEAVHDYAASPGSINMRAAIMSMVSHLVFGGVTFLVMRFGFGPALCSAIAIHMVYNMFLVRGESR